MNYEVYNEESNIISLSDYKNIKHKMEGNYSHRPGKTVHLRKIYFNKDINYLESHDRNSDRFSMNMKDGEYDYISLERKSVREGVIHRVYTYLTREQCRQILNKDIEWMKESQNELLYDLYLQMTINQIEPGVAVDYEREVYRLSNSSSYIIFNRSIRSTYDLENQDCLSWNIDMTERIPKDHVIMTFQHAIEVPNVITNIMHLGENRRMIRG